MNNKEYEIELRYQSKLKEQLKAWQEVVLDSTQPDDVRERARNHCLQIIKSLDRSRRDASEDDCI